MAYHFVYESTKKNCGLCGPVLSLPKDCLDFSLVNLRDLRAYFGLAQYKPAVFSAKSFISGYLPAFVQTVKCELAGRDDADHAI